jgi:hypothetical protein
LSDHTQARSSNRPGGERTVVQIDALDQHVGTSRSRTEPAKLAPEPPLLQAQM